MSSSKNVLRSCICQTDVALDDLKTCFEQPPNDSIEEDDTLKKFNNEIVYADERYTVLLPWRVGSQFTINYSQLSLSRLHSVI